ncbi:non-ribosomal peptide synthase protein (TIGR01720 family)/amino acid adenylation domain-containing protein, partial [Paracidovorax anthurii]
MTFATKPEAFRLSLQQRGIAEPGAESLQATVAILIEAPAGTGRAALERALAGLVARHEILRTRYRPVAGSSYPVQEPWPDLAAAWKTLDGAPADEELLVAARGLIDAQGGAVLGVVFHDAGPAGVRLAMAAPRCSLDLRGIQDLAQACAASATASRTDGAAQEDPLQYADYAAWQAELLESALGQEGMRYWQARAGDAGTPPRLPFERKRCGAEFAGRGAVSGHGERRALGDAQARALREGAAQAGTTLETVALAWWSAFVARQAGADTVSVQWWLGDRQDELLGALGNFAVRLPVSLALDPGHDGPALARAVQAQCREAASWHECFDPAAHAEWRAREGREAAGVEFEYVPIAPLPAGWRVAALQSQGTAARLRCELQEGPNGMALIWHSDGAFDEATLAAWHRQFARSLEDLAAGQGPWTDARLLDAADRDAVLRAGHVGEATHTPVKTGLHGLFEAQARQRPHHPALRCGRRQLTYGELDARAQALALRLGEAGVGPGDLVGVLIGRSEQAVVAMLGVLKAGAAYVPIDPAYPAARVQYVLADAGIRTVVAAQTDLPALADPGLRVIALDGELARAGIPRLPMAVAPDSLAYVIYTSGSTGKPKGVQISHANAVASTLARHACYEKEPVTAYLLLSSFSFDSSVAGIYWTLSQGGTLCIPTEDEYQDPVRIAQLVRESSISHLLALPSFYRQLVESVAQGPLRCVVVAGEACHPDVVAAHARHVPAAALVNEYGPTEGTVWSHAWRIDPADGEERIPIGYPVGGTTSVVLDHRLEPCPPGMAGELYIGGAGIARGYLGRAVLTAERFVADPFVSGQRLYRTGDLARLRLDGVVEYLGRIDHQVKIRGHRIELGEIETLLLAQPGVDEAVVVALEGRLVAYLSPALGAGAEQALRRALEHALPAYMVPSALVALAQLPHTPNGKVDRQALPHPDSVRERDYEPPQNAREEAFCAIWRDVLNVGRVGRGDNFFELGGDSILGLQIVARLRKAGWRIAPKQLFECQTIARLAGEAQAIETAQEMTQVEGDVPLAPIQAAFFALPVPQRNHWNQSVLLRPRGALDLPAFAKALAAVLGHHDALRLRFEEGGAGVVRQFYGPQGDAADVLWQRSAGHAGDLLTLCEQAQRSLDLERGPLLRALAVELPDASWRVLLVVHHLAVDGVSWRILLEDLQAAYEQARAGRDVVLPAKTASYKDWTLSQHARGQELCGEPAHWLALADIPGPALPCARPEGAHTLADAAVETLVLDVEQTAALLKEAPAAYRTQANDLLLTALAQAVSAWTGEPRVWIDLEGHGRGDSGNGLDVSRTVGWFTAVHPVVLDASGAPGAAIKRVKERLRAVPHHGVDHGLLRHFGTEAQRAALAGLPRPQILFNYLGQFDGSFDGSTQWLPAQEPVGASQDPAAPLEYELALNGQVLDGRLTLNLTYSAARHDAATMHGLLEGLREALVALTAHCLGCPRGATPSDFPLAGLAQQDLDRLPLPLEAVQDLYPLSPMQQGMLFHSAFDAGGAAYINQLRIDVAGLDSARFEQAWQAALVRHEALRTGFLQGDVPLQWVARGVAAPFTHHDWGTHADIEAALDRLAKEELDRGFNLAEPPLMRFVLVRRPDGRHHFIWTHHHLLMDGWSAAQVLGEVLRQYGGASISTPSGQYRDYIDWLARHDAQASRRYWRAQVARIGEPTRAALALPRREDGAGQGEQQLQIDAARAHQLAQWASAQHVTLNTLVQGAWAHVLARCLGRDAVCFGATVAGRPDELPQAQQTVGVFINTLPVAVDMPAHMPVGDWLRMLQASNLAAREHETLPLQDIQRLGGQGAQAYFDSIVVFENYPVDGVLRDAQSLGLEFDGLRAREETNYPVTLVVAHSGPLSIVLRHARKDVDARTAGFLLQALDQQLAALSRDAGAPLGSIALSVARGPDFPSHGEAVHVEAKTVHRQIEEQAQRTPDAVAVVFGGQTLSYAELNARAN